MTKIFGHRGAAGDYPENTMVSFQAAYDGGADGIELDIQRTKDGRLVVIHDEKVDRTTDGVGYVEQLSLQEIRQLNAAAKWQNTPFQSIPLVEEVLEWVSDKSFYLNIELKNNVIPYDGMEEQLIEMLYTYGLKERIILSSFNHESMVKAARLCPELETALLLSDSLVAPWVYANQLGISSLHPKWRHVNKEYISRAHLHSTVVRPYTVNKSDILKKLFQANVDAIITDYPKKALDIRNKILL